MRFNKKKWDNFWKKFWFIVWKDESLKGWFISIILIFILIRFIFFPLLNLATGTSLSLAIVESCSMYHNNDILSFNDFEEWWNRKGHSETYEKRDINKTEFSGFGFSKGLNKGDILFITKVKPQDIEIGDVIIFVGGPQNKPIIHRVVDIDSSEDEKFFKTMGDNVGRVQFFEEKISEKQIVGKARFKIAPVIGWVKLIFFEPLRKQDERGFCKEN
ncbi:MAG: signal peptidase I [Nanoarchaeota archaeon]